MKINENKTILSLKKYDLDRSLDQNEKTLFSLINLMIQKKFMV